MSTSVINTAKLGVNVPLMEEYLRQLHLKTFVRNWESFAQDAAQSGHSYDGFLMGLAEHEVNHRQKNRYLTRIKAARFPALKELADFDFAAVPSLNKVGLLELARGDYIAKAENLILVGNPGLGKSHISIGLALAACRQGHSVRFFNAATLVNDLLVAHDLHHAERFIASARKLHLIVLDELGFIPFSASGAQLLFQFCSALHDHVPLIINSNLKFADWVQLFGSEALTAALLDRLTHRAHIIEFSGAESFRFKQRLKRLSKPALSASDASAT